MDDNTLIVGNSGNRVKALLQRVTKHLKDKTKIDLAGGGSNSLALITALPAVRTEAYNFFINEANRRAIPGDTKALQSELTRLFDNGLGINNNIQLFENGSGSSGIAISAIGTMTLLSLSWPENVHRWMMPSSVRTAPIVRVKYIKWITRRGNEQIEEPASLDSINNTMKRPLLGPTWTNSETAPTAAWIESNTRNEAGDPNRAHPVMANAFNLLSTAWNDVTIGVGDGIDNDSAVAAVKYKVRVGVNTYEERIRNVDISIDPSTGVGRGFINWVNPHDQSAGSDTVVVIIDRQTGALIATTALGISSADNAVGITKILMRAYKTTEHINTVESLSAQVIDDQFTIPQGPIVQVPLTDDNSLDFNAMTGLDFQTASLDALTAKFGRAQNNDSYNFLESTFQKFIQEAETRGYRAENFERTWSAMPPSAGNMDVAAHRRTFALGLNYLIAQLQKYTNYREHQIVIVCGYHDRGLFYDVTAWQATGGGDGGTNDTVSDKNLIVGVTRLFGDFSARVVTSRDFREGSMYVYLTPKGEENVRGIEHFSYDYRISREHRSPVYMQVPAITATRREVRKAFNPAMARLTIVENNGNYPSMQIQRV